MAIRAHLSSCWAIMVQNTGSDLRIGSRYEGMISMFCSQCGAPMGDNDKFCGVCGAPNTAAPRAAASASQPQFQPQPFVAPQPVMNVPKGCMTQAFNDMIKVPGALVRVCQIAFCRRSSASCRCWCCSSPLPVALRRPLAFCSLTWQACAVPALLSSGVATCRSRMMTVWSVRCCARPRLDWASSRLSLRVCSSSSPLSR